MAKVDLPEDLLFIVLAKLPVTTLLKLRLVSKFWADLIQNQEFIRNHLNLSLLDANSQKFIFDTQQPNEIAVLNGDFSNVSHKELYCWEPVYYQKKRLVGCSNGILCIRYVRDGVYLCNPWTRKNKKLPKCRLEIFPDEKRSWNCNVYGFGYDDIHDDYKVVSLIVARTKSSGEFGTEVKIYSVKSNYWKLLIENLPHETAPCKGNGVLHSHALHWILGNQECILAIDLRTEEHRFLEVPNGIKRRRELDSNLEVLDDNLCLSNRSVLGFEIWLMKDYGIKNSWTKMVINFQGIDYTATLLTYSESEKKLIFSHKYMLYLYDTEKEKILNKKSLGFRIRNFFYTVESLVQFPLRTSHQRGKRSRIPNKELDKN